MSTFFDFFINFQNIEKNNFLTFFAIDENDVYENELKTQFFFWYERIMKYYKKRYMIERENHDFREKSLKKNSIENIAILYFNRLHDEKKSSKLFMFLSCFTFFYLFLIFSHLKSLIK